MENVNSEAALIPEATDNNDIEKKTETTPDIFVPIKFNKEVRNLDLQKASELAQKGLKFEAISEDYGNLRRIAQRSGKSVSEFLAALEKNHKEERKKELLAECGGNEEMADYVLNLEKNPHENIGFEELQAEFPEIKNVSDLPDSVIENANLRGTLLLDEYLRYRHKARKNAGKAAAQNVFSENASIGSQTDRKGGTDPETAEFLRGLWK